MSETPSPKPKPGSLRDRIAAFENANKSAAPTPAPAPRPKPSTLQSWKPKAPSPPHSPEPGRTSSGMSASDAVESIGRGVSLKERMAALQGKGAFGGVAPTPAPPKPAEKPKWKPPPRPLSPPADEAAPTCDSLDLQRSPSLSADDPDQVEGEHEAQQDAAETEHDPEEEERQRRAAIAARMARLGGARVGMGPPVFGGKPAPKKPETLPAQLKQEEETTIELNTDQVISPPMEASNPLSSAKEEARTDSDYPPSTARQDSDASSLSLVDPSPSITSSRSSLAMPVPTGPRRAAPPRKKAYKSPSASQFSEVPASTTVPKATEEAIDSTPTVELTAGSASELEPESVAPSSVTKETSHETVESPEQDSVPSSDEVLVIGDIQKEIAEVGKGVETDASEMGPVDEHEEEQYVSTDVEPQPVPEQEDRDEEGEEEEEEEEARRRRVAAKLSQMGAVNPLAGPPPVPRRESIPSPTASHSSIPVAIPAKEPLDVEDEVNVDLEEVGESVSTPMPSRSPPEVHVEAPEAPEARDADERGSRAAESDGEPQPDLGTTRRVLYRDEMDEEQYDSPERDEVAPGSPSSSGTYFLDADVPSAGHTPRPIPHGDKSGEDHLTESAISAQVPPLNAVDSAGSYQVFAQEPGQDQDDDDMAHIRITRPVPPPPVNLTSKPSISLPSPPPPPRTPLYALHAGEDRPESPAPRPVPPPVKSVKAAQEAAPAPPPRVARRTSASASVKSIDMETPSTPRVPTSPRPPVRRPTSPPIITTLPLIVPAPENEEDVEQEFVDCETPSQPQQIQEPEEENEEALRRRTIADRMARLGGIRFGAPPVPMPLSRPSFPRAPPPTSIPPDDPAVDTEEPVQEEMETEEDEAARKQRIAAKLVGMGGMRFGMLPSGAGVAPATARRLASRQDDSENEDAALPVPAPPSRRPPPPVEVDSEQEQSLGTSDDGVRVELEDSEIEEVYYSDAAARASVEEEISPILPPRRPSVTTRLAEALPTPPPRVTSRSPPPVGRPPVPSIPATLLNRRPSTTTGSSPSSRKSSDDYSVSSDTPAQKQRMHPTLESVLSDSGVEPHSEYVMVEPESAAEEEPPVPPRRRSFRAPPRAIPLPPPPPPSAIDPPEEMVSSTQWELPSIPQAASELSDEGDLSSPKFSDDSTFHESSSFSTRKSQSRRTSAQTTRPAEQQLSVDELMAIWGKVGVQVVDSATKLFEKSKRSLVGDGSYAGFVRAAIAQVPNARRESGDDEDWGYLIYTQTAGFVQRRVAEIMPGDVIGFWDAKLKGHKGLQTYSQSVGAGDSEPLLGVVSEVEGKKSKVRVWQANQHVGQQTVENVSYRLEDLKSGHVKVFRVMEA